MDGGIVQIIVAAITVCVPASVTLITTVSVKRDARKHSARQSILQLIFEDKVRYLEGLAPENYQAVLDEYDQYVKNGGNSYIKEKTNDYISWYKKVTKKKLTKK